MNGANPTPVHSSSGDSIPLPTLALIDPSEFRRTCVAASLSSQGFDHISQISSTTASSIEDGHDIAILLPGTDHDRRNGPHSDIARLLGGSGGLRIVLLVDDPADYIRQSGDRHRAVQAILPLNMEPGLLSALLRAVHLGYRIVPDGEVGGTNPAAREQAGQGRSTAALESHALLARTSARQREVLNALLAGHGNREIARILGISESTVKAHVHYLMRILGVSSRTQLVLKLLHAGGEPSAARGGQA